MKVAGLIALAGALSSVLAEGNSTSSPVSPLKDDFYKAPSGYQSKKAGEVLKSRQLKVDDSLMGIANVDKMYQIMYRTTNSLNNATYAVTTLFVPNGADSSKLLSYQVAEDANYLGCAPSYTLQSAQNVDDGIAKALNDSIVVVSPDYEGPNSAFTAGILSGHATLDSIRAVLNFKDYTLKDPNIVMWGYSGGSIATGWANQLQPAYAPELGIAGAAMGGVVANVTAVAEYVNEGTGSGFVPAGLMGLATEYPELDKIIQENLFPQNKSDIMEVRGQCLTEDLLEFIGEDIFSYFKKGEGILDLPQVQAIMANLTMGEDAPGAPMFIYEGQSDEVVPFEIVKKAVKDFCSHKDTDILFISDPDTTHVETSEAGLNVAYQWLKDRLEGKSVSKGCSSTTTSFDAASTSYPGRQNGTVSASATGSGSGSVSATSSTGSNAGVPVTINSGVFAAAAVAVAALL